MNNDDDKLPVADVGEWAWEKHERLRRYVDITRAVRRKYTKGPGGATYIDLFCGPGRARISETGEIIDGSPLVAFKTAVETKVPFTQIHIADIDPESTNASIQRIAAAGGHAIGYTGRAENTAQQVISRLNPYGLHFAFLDPFNLESLSFPAIATLAKMKHMDLLLHVSVQDLQRNLDRYINATSSPLDAFAPGWRAKIDLNQSPKAIRAALFAYWQSQMGNLGYPEPRGVELVRGTKQQRLYWLVFLSKHELGNEFWNKIRHIGGQGNFDF